MFNPETWQSHDEYRTIVVTYGRRLSRNNPCYHFHIYDEERKKLLDLDLDPIRDYISRYYSTKGRTAINQAQILRSLVLFVLLFNRTKARTSLTSWVREVLPNDISLAVLCGFESTDKLPPLGSYYDFMNRLWLASRERYSRNCLLPSGKNGKNGKKPQKIIGTDGKLVEDASETSSTRSIVDDILHGNPATDNPEAALQEIFTLLALLPSIRAGLIDTENLTLSGDGTAVTSHSSPYGALLSSCGTGCPFLRTCQRHYSDPDADWGWDSDNKCWYFGHTLYMLCYRNGSLKVELPITMKFTEARRHDSKSFLYAIDNFGRHSLGLTPKNVCLDSAHDNIPTYELLDHWGINALIDINGRAKSSPNSPEDISFDKEGHPLCMAGHKMCPWGNDPIKDARKYRCPLKCRRIDSCPHAEACSPGNYGRTVYIKNHGDLRFQTRIPRDSEQYKKIYGERTACERINDRVLNDYCLQHLKIRGKDHFSFWTMLIGICIHLDARYKNNRLGNA